MYSHTSPIKIDIRNISHKQLILVDGPNNWNWTPCAHNQSRTSFGEEWGICGQSCTSGLAYVPKVVDSLTACPSILNLKGGKLKKFRRQQREAWLLPFQRNKKHNEILL
eukprot:2475880-Amphidinium_carterae.1